MRKGRNTDLVVIASPVYFYGISTQLKAIVDRLHTPARNEFHIKKLALIYFHLEDVGMVLVKGAKKIKTG